MPTDFFSTTAGRTLARLVLALILLAMWQYLPSPDLRFWMSGPLEIVARLCELDRSTDRCGRMSVPRCWRWRWAMRSAPAPASRSACCSA